MLRIADEHIPLAHSPAAVLSNLFYVGAALVLAAVYGPAVVPVSFALVVQAYGSMLFHGTTEEARWAQMIDAVGIQMVMSALLCLTAHAVFGVAALLAYAPLVAVWPAWWLFAHHTDRNDFIAGQGAVVLIVLTLEVPLWAVGGLAALAGGAVAVQRLFPVHSGGHALWHGLSAAAQALSVVLLFS